MKKFWTVITEIDPQSGAIIKKEFQTHEQKLQEIEHRKARMKKNSQNYYEKHKDYLISKNAKNNKIRKEKKQKMIEEQQKIIIEQQKQQLIQYENYMKSIQQQQEIIMPQPSKPINIPLIENMEM